MHSLEEIADNPLAATISENLVLVADPFDDFKKHGGLSSGKKDEVIEALKEHFRYGSGLISRFNGDLVSLESSKYGFKRMVVPNSFEMLKILMDNRPDVLDQRCAKLYRQHKHALKSKKRPKDIDEDIFKLLKYTHDFHHYIVKRNGQNPFASLQKIPLDNVTFYTRDTPDRGFPNYDLYGWLERVKTRERIVKKILYKIFETMDNADDNKERFYKQSFGTDYFGVRVIGAGQEIMGDESRIRQKVERIFSPMGVSQWNSIWFEDYSQTKGKELRALEYLLRYSDGTGMPDILQLQVFTLTHLLLDDFFSTDNRVRLEMERIARLKAYEKANPRLYRRMEESISNILSFLPK